METKQPTWQLIANIGDVNPLDYGGYFVYRDTTGVYCEEAEKLFVDDDDCTWTVYRFAVERCQMIEGFLVPGAYKDSWKYPVERYDEWFHKSLGSVADFVGRTVQELRDDLCSEDPILRAFVYEAIFEYHGWANADGYPLEFKDRKEVEERYSKKNQ